MSHHILNYTLAGEESRMWKQSFLRGREPAAKAPGDRRTRANEHPDCVLLYPSCTTCNTIAFHNERDAHHAAACALMERF